jgi:dCMP deaminase
MRLSRDEWGLRLTEVTALRGTCLRRQVGCVLTDADGHILSTGYNGVAAGMPHCNETTGWHLLEFPNVIDEKRSLEEQATRRAPIYDNACTAAGAASGTSLDACEALHAELNAVMQCRDVKSILTCYVTISPCMSCTKMLINTGCRRIVFRQTYSMDCGEFWLKQGAMRTWKLCPGG